MQKLVEFKKTENKINQEVHKVSTRLFPPYTKRVAEVLHAAKMTQSELTRFAIMMTVDGDLINLNNRLARIEEQLIWLRKEFSEGVE